MQSSKVKSRESTRWTSYNDNIIKLYCNNKSQSDSIYLETQNTNLCGLVWIYPPNKGSPKIEK